MISTNLYPDSQPTLLQHRPVIFYVSSSGGTLYQREICMTNQKELCSEFQNHRDNGDF